MTNYDKRCILRALRSYKDDVLKLIKKYPSEKESIKKEISTIDKAYNEIYDEIYPDTGAWDLFEEV